MMNMLTKISTQANVTSMNRFTLKFLFDFICECSHEAHDVI